MELTHIAYQGPEVDDEALLAQLPSELSRLLRQINGFVQFSGGLHVRGACAQPPWHSLRAVIGGPGAIHVLFPAVRSSDVPFAQDCLGDQFLLRDGEVLQLQAETGELESRGCGLMQFLEQAQQSPVEYLSLQPLLQFHQEGGSLQLGQLLNVYPPFCSKEAADGVSLRAVPAEERLRFLGGLSAQLAQVPENGKLQLRVEE